MEFIEGSDDVHEIFATEELFEWSLDFISGK